VILLVTNRGDVTTDFVVAALRRRGAPFVRLNTEDLLRRWRFTWTTSGWKAADSRGRALRSRDVRAAYYRRPRTPHPVDGTADAAGAFAGREGATLLRGLCADTTAFWISEPAAIEVAEDKLLQLRTACALGFDVPPTIVTNVPEEAHEFVAAVGKAIVKPLSSGQLSGEPPQLAYTAELHGDDDLADVALAPHLIQQRVDKLADLRVTVVSESVFACRIASQAHVATSLDWRRATSEGIDLDHEMVELPPNERARCVALVRTLGLRFGAIDLVETRAGLTFLEINPNGQWAWIEQRTGAPIADALAAALVGEGGYAAA